MTAETRIHFYTNNQINRQRWDECVAASPANMIYGKSFYLDHLAHGWSGLIGGNYDWVLPITERTKFGIRYLYQPNFTQQLGVFAKKNINTPYEKIIEWLLARYKFCEVNWNFTTPWCPFQKRACLSSCTNFTLDLNNSYVNIAAHYHNDLIRNLRYSKRFKPAYRLTPDYNSCIETYKEYYSVRMPKVTEVDFENFKNLCEFLRPAGKVICREAVSQDNDVLASVLLLRDGNRLYNLMNTTKELGRYSSGNHFLLDSLIREFSGKNLLLDFEGSDLPGVKHFYENFGAVNERYCQLKYNNLPGIIRLFKR